jgi:hypothetical protein
MAINCSKVALMRLRRKGSMFQGGWSSAPGSGGAFDSRRRARHLQSLLNLKVKTGIVSPVRPLGTARRCRGVVGVVEDSPYADGCGRGASSSAGHGRRGEGLGTTS